MQAGWYIDKGYHHGKLSFIYQGWFPVINLSVDYGDKAFNVDWTQNDKGQDITQGHYTQRNLVEAEEHAMQISFRVDRCESCHLRLSAVFCQQKV